MFSVKPAFNFIGTLLGVTAISISVYFNINPNFKNYTLEPGQTTLVDQNIGYGFIYYNIDIESNFKMNVKGSMSFFEGTEFSMVYLNDTILLHFTNYNKNETVSIELPENAKLIVSCSNNIVGKVKCSIRERKTFPRKNYSFVPNYRDTAKFFIQPGKENLVYENNSSSAVLLQVCISNYFKENLKTKAVLPFADEVIIYVKRPNENKRALKPLKQMAYLQTGQKKILTYMLQPGYSLNIKTFDKELTGYCYFQKSSLAF